MDTAVFLVSKLAAALIRPDTWLVVAIGLMLAALVAGRRRLAFGLAAPTFAALLALAILPLGDLLLQPIERTFPTDPPLARVDGIVVLGGGEDARSTAYWGQVQLNEGAERYTAALALAKRFPEARLLFTGGSGALRDIAGGGTSEASVASRFFRDQGIAPARLLLEDKSRTTTENARLSLALAAPAPPESWVLVTSAFHMPRAMRSFEAAGWTRLVPYPVDYRTGAFADGIGWDLTGHLKVLDIALHEWIGQLIYRMAGR